MRSTCTSRTAGTEKQISHMAALLAESEALNTRLEKLSEVLKEEIRTYQRSEERHKHIENLEYVKNVILKVNVTRSLYYVFLYIASKLRKYIWAEKPFYIFNSLSNT